MTEARVDVGLVVRDTQASLQFYRDTLGLKDLGELVFPHATMQRLLWGKTMVKLSRPAELPEAANPGGSHLGAVGLRYITLTVDDVEETLTRCAAAGYPTVMERTEVRPGVVVGFVQDPDGNNVEFLQT